jgi:hypothetical protein
LKEIVMKTLVRTFGWFLLLALFGSSAFAQNQRSFVSGAGLDTNSCGPTTPCRTFARAISQTNTGGEIIVLDSAGYGAFSITKSVSIIASPGVYSGISVFSGDGIDVNAGTGAVILRGLTVNNQGSTGSGINFTGTGILHVESCVASGFNGGEGISSTGGGALEVKDSIFRGNADGISISGVSTATIDHARLEENGFNGLLVQDGSNVTISNSLASGNGLGFHAFSNVAAVQLNIESCLVCYNATGIEVGNMDPDVTATVRVSNTTVTDNGSVNSYGLENATFGGPSLLLSRGNNTVASNTTDTAGVIGSYSAK